MSQSSQETLQAQLAIYDEHLTQAQHQWINFKEQLALSRAATREDLQSMLASRCQSYQRIAAAPPATCAAEDRARLLSIGNRPLSETEQLVMHAKGNALTRCVVLLCGLFCPIIPLLAVRRVRELRQQAFREWSHTLHNLEREIMQGEQDLCFQKDTDEQRILRSQIAHLDHTIQQLQLQRDLLLARMQGQEIEHTRSFHRNAGEAEPFPPERTQE